MDGEQPVATLEQFLAERGEPLLHTAILLAGGRAGSEDLLHNLAMSACCWRAGMNVVPFWYYVIVAMNLRLDDEDSALLKALAEAEHVSLHEAALRAIRRSARELAHTDRVREATAEMLGRWGDVLDRLGHA